MDMLAHSLDNTRQEKHGVGVQEEEDEPTAVAVAGVPQAAAFADHHVQYQLRTDGGQVTYRVVQVTEQSAEGRDEGGGAVSVVSAAAFAGAPQAVAQAVIQNPFSNGGSPVGEAVGGETRFAYFPGTAVSDGAVSVQPEPTLTQTGGSHDSPAERRAAGGSEGFFHAAASSEASSSGGAWQFYVMMTPPDVLQAGAQRNLTQHTQQFSPKMDGPRAPRDDRRRAQHNEVERRRRDKINNWIVTLSKIIPDCTLDSTKSGASKGGILSKACDYIRELRQSNQQLQESLTEVDRIQVDNELCRRQIEELKSENALLRAQLQQHGIELVGEGSSQ